MQRATRCRQMVLVLAICALGTTHARSLAPERSSPSLVQQIMHVMQSGLARLHPSSPSSPDLEEMKGHWALLVAGSSGWWNYRHQSDVCHAYQILRGGLLPERIVVMIYDDIANNMNNPFPGKIFNRPGGPDVYAGVQVDYSGLAVNSSTVLAVLEGNSSAVAGLGSGKVIASGPQDRVFVFYSDHGAPGVLGMPTGPFLFADELHTAIQRKHRARGYRTMTVYIEACESGSMFQGLLGPELDVYATTASNADESSWGTYCPGMEAGGIDELDTCLGDLYSVAWMEDSECQDLQEETLKDQFKIVQKRTSDNFTYGMGSHVMRYGRLDMQKETLSTYLGLHTMSACMRPAETPWYANGRGRHSHRVKQRDADLVPLKMKVAKAKSAAEAREAQAHLDIVVHERQRVDDGLQAAATHLLMMRDVGHVLMTNLGWNEATVFQASHSSANSLRPAAGFLTELMSSPMGRGQGSGRPLVDSWDCLREMVNQYTQECGPMDQYSMKHTRLFANLCNAGVNARGWRAALAASGACAAANKPTTAAI